MHNCNLSFTGCVFLLPTYLKNCNERSSKRERKEEQERGAALKQFSNKEFYPNKSLNFSVFSLASSKTALIVISPCLLTFQTAAHMRHICDVWCCICTKHLFPHIWEWILSIPIYITYTRSWQQLNREHWEGKSSLILKGH